MKEKERKKVVGISFALHCVCSEIALPAENPVQNAHTVHTVCNKTQQKRR